MNHTSNEHPWFRWAIGEEPTKEEREKYSDTPYNWDIPTKRDERMKKYQSYYWFINSKPDKNTPWRDDEGLNEAKATPWKEIKLEDGSSKWFLHTFSDFKPDLNWNNPAVRKEMAKVANFWINKGVKGFRLDAIPLIGKDVNKMTII